MTLEKQLPSRHNLYLGKAGQFAVMAECLVRDFNVAVPEVDVGDDLFVINDDNGNYRRIQVKAANARGMKTGYSAQFQVPLTQLKQGFSPDLIYIFATRFLSTWKPFIVIPRDELFTLYEVEKFGTESKNGKYLQLYFTFKDNGEVVCSGRSLAVYKDRFDNLPDTIPSNI